MVHRSIRQILVSAVFVAVLTGCTGGQQTSRAPQPASGAKPHVRLCIIQDTSGSILQTRTVILRPEEHIRPLLKLVTRRGGEVGFTIVAERSDKPLARFPATEPLEPEPKPPGNPLLRSRWTVEVLRPWQTRSQELEKRVLRFLDEVKARLKGPLASKSDVCGAVRRCDLMLAEPYSRPATRTMLVVSDGLHNVRTSRCPVPLLSQAQVIVVNGEGELGVLKLYRPIRFESPGPAVEYIIRAAGERP